MAQRADAALVDERDADRDVSVSTRAAPSGGQDRQVRVDLTVNGRGVGAVVDTRTTLLDFLRDELGLTGTKKGCDRGECGACTVIADGRRINSCLTLAVMRTGNEITTIEGVAEAGRLHPLQDAFVELDALQCGFCTPGQVMSSLGLVHDEHRVRSATEIQEHMSGNLCRCSAYPNILAAIQRYVGSVAEES